MYHEVFTPSAWKILEALDQEKMNILATSWTDSRFHMWKCANTATVWTMRVMRRKYSLRMRQCRSVRRDQLIREFQIYYGRHSTGTGVDGITGTACLDIPVPDVYIVDRDSQSAALGTDFRAGGRTLAQTWERRTCSKILEGTGRRVDGTCHSGMPLKRTWRMAESLRDSSAAGL